jgi:hypothetical protein
VKVEVEPQLRPQILSMTRLNKHKDARELDQAESLWSVRSMFEENGPFSQG